MEDHLCIRERIYREEDYLAALTEKELTEYENRAKEGDADTICTFSRGASRAEQRQT